MQLLHRFDKPIDHWTHPQPPPRTPGPYQTFLGPMTSFLDIAIIKILALILPESVRLTWSLLDSRIYCNLEAPTPRIHPRNFARKLQSTIHFSTISPLCDAVPSDVMWFFEKSSPREESGRKGGCQCHICRCCAMFARYGTLHDIDWDQTDRLTEKMSLMCCTIDVRVFGKHWKTAMFHHI